MQTNYLYLVWTLSHTRTDLSLKTDNFFLLFFKHSPYPTVLSLCAGILVREHILFNYLRPSILSLTLLISHHNITLPAYFSIYKPSISIYFVFFHAQEWSPPSKRIDNSSPLFLKHLPYPTVLVRWTTVSALS